VINISLVGSFRYPGTSGSSQESDRIINFSGFQPSGIADGNLQGVALWVYSGNSFTGNGYWIPLAYEWLKWLSTSKLTCVQIWTEVSSNLANLANAF